MKMKSLATKKIIKDTRVLQPAYTVRLKPDAEEPALQPKETTVTWCGLSDTGKVRDHNEDSFSSTPFGESILFVVADGMGGHEAGEVASRLAVDTVVREVGSHAKGDYDPRKLLKQAVKKANRAVSQEGVRRGSSMGTTLTAALVTGDRAHIANVGDSRTYWIENGSIRQITEDHSLVAKLVSVGKLTREEARNHPKSNLLYRTIGTDENVKVDSFEVDLKKGGGLLLCSDGLWNEVKDEDIHKICVAEKDMQAACARLVELANRNGGRDNITAVIVKVM
jgi:protein phosphatase